MASQTPPSQTNGLHIDTTENLSKHPSQHHSKEFLRSLSPATLAVHADDPLNTSFNDVAPPLHVSTNFRYPRSPSLLKPFHERPTTNGPMLEVGEFCYSRHSTHSSTRLEEILGYLLQAPGRVVSYSSGLTALHGLLTYLNPKRVSIGDGYHGCHGVLDIHKRLTGAKTLPLDCPAEELHEGDLLHLETPVNPTGLAFDIAHYAQKAHSRGAFLSVDATFAPPPLLDPFRWGADVIMHSGTKYLGGHSDMLCGVLAVREGREDWVRGLLGDREFVGGVLGGLEAWLGVRSVRTLELRVMRQSENATQIVEALDGALDPAGGHTVSTIGGLSELDAKAVRKVVKSLTHASLQRSDMDWLGKQMPNGYGPVFGITMKSVELAKRLPSKLMLFHHATSLGGVESLIEWRYMSDKTVGKDFMRVSVGVEDRRDLLDDFLRAFRELGEEEF